MGKGDGNVLFSILLWFFCTVMVVPSPDSEREWPDLNHWVTDFLSVLPLFFCSPPPNNRTVAEFILVAGTGMG